MAFEDILLVAEDLDFPSDEAVDNAPAAVGLCAVHDYAVLYLGVQDGGVVTDARVGADYGVWANVTVVSNDGGASYGCSAVDGGAAADGDVVCDDCGLFEDSGVVGVEVVSTELARCEEELGFVIE